MRRNRTYRKWTILGLGTAAVLFAAAVTTPRFARSAQPGDDFANEFWDWLDGAKYRQWAPWPGQDTGLYPGQAPHGAFLEMYVNRKTLTNTADPPHGSIIVKENYAGDKETLAAITVMYRVKDYAPENGDWYWVKYNPDGTVAETDGKPIAGKVQSCIQCHGGAKGNDFVFANDTAQNAPERKVPKDEPDNGSKKETRKSNSES